MVCNHNFAIPIFILVISTTFHFRLFNVEGRKLVGSPPHNSKAESVEEEKVMWRVQIGSRPPRCERLCGSCARCQAIQVPTTPKSTTQPASVPTPGTKAVPITSPLAGNVNAGTSSSTLD